MPLLLPELRFALRALLKNPGFTAVAAITLALGIGATSAVFDLIQGVLLTPPPYLKPERIILISPARADGNPYSRDWTIGHFLEFQNEAKSFAAIAGYGWTFDFLTLPEGSESIRGMQVTRDYFKVIGIKPLLGREFLESEAPATYWDQTVIILGHDLWRRRFNADPNIVGKTVRLGIFEKSLTVVGVMPPRLRFLPTPSDAHEPNYDVNAQVEFWLCAKPDPSKPKEGNGSVIGRLREGAALAQARAELNGLTARHAQADRDFEGIVAKAEPISDELNREGRRLLLPLFGAVALVFLIACANVTGLLLARGVQRQQEFAVRCVLGAGRLRLFRQALTESLLLAIIGGLLGAGLAFAIVKVLRLVGAQAIPRLEAVQTNWIALFFCFGLALVAAVIAGLLPAIRASQMDPALALKGGRSTSASQAERRLLRGVAILQTALTVALLAGAALLIRTVSNLTNLHPGYNTQRMLTMNVTDVNWGKYFDFHERALARLASLPSVKDAAFAWGVPLTGDSWVNAIDIEGQPGASRIKDLLWIPTRSVTPNYFDMLGQRILAGRNFSSAHSVPTNGVARASVAIINQAMAERCFPNTNPIGKRFRYTGHKDWWIEIIGVVADARTSHLTRTAAPEIYFSFWEAMMRTKHLIVQTVSDPRLVASTVQRELRAIQPTLAIENVKTFEQIRRDSIAPQTFAMRLLLGFSFIASVLAVVGIYGVLSLSVGSRKREIAIRMAIGAQRRNVLKLILSEGLRLVLIGLALGVGAALALGQVLKSFLFGVQPTDPVTLSGVAILFTLVALMGCYFPARRATEVDPVNALRDHEIPKFKFQKWLRRRS